MRLLIYLIFFYFLFKIAKYLIALFVGSGSEKKETVRETKKENLKIKQEDIIEAEFEEIENSEKEKRDN